MDSSRQGEMDRQLTRLEGKELSLTHLDKLLFADPPITKADLIRYYTSIAPVLLPHLRNRPLSLTRFPEGISAPGFWEKEAPSGKPDWVKTFTGEVGHTGRPVHYIVCNDLPTLVWLANLDCIEMHPWFSRLDQPDYPDFVVFDLDPSPPATMEDIAQVAVAIRQALDFLHLDCWLKTSGASGLHIYLPLQREFTYDQTRLFARRLAELVAGQFPHLVTLEWRLEKRRGIRIDYTQNAPGKTLASVYSLRPQPGGPVSCPLAWEELQGGLNPADFNFKTIFKRLELKGDLFRPVLENPQSLTPALDRLNLA